MAAWPDAAALTAWIGDANVSADGEAKFPDVIAAVTEAIVDRLDPDLLPLDASCPDSVRQAILIESARVFTRSQATNGVISMGDIAIRVGRYDPDVDRLIRKYMPWPDP